MPDINLLIKPASSNCNLRCVYCFYQSEAASRSVASYGMMAEDTLEAVVRRGLEYADSYCGFAFQGGEPTLAGLPFFQKLVSLEQQYNTKNIRISNSIQTNGTLIDEKWCAFLHDHHFLIGLSLDGPKEIHNLHRVDARQNGTFNRVMKTAGLFDRYQVEYNILSVVTANSCRFVDKIYDFYKKSGFRYLQFINCLDPTDEEHGKYAYSLKPDDLGKFLNRLFDRWYEDFMQGNYVSIRYFDNLVRMINGQRPEACNMTGVCHSSCVIEADGSVYPCDFYAVDEWKTGNIRDNSIKEILETDKSRAFEQVSLNISDSCKSCKWYPICRGGCRRECEPIDPDAPRLNYYCAAYSSFFEHAYDRLCRAAEVARRYSM